MASIRLEFQVHASPDAVWRAFRAVGDVHTALAPGFVTDCVLDGDVRTVTFANGFVARELIVDVDDAARRLAYSARGPTFEHHHASFQISDDGPGRARVAWIADLLPEDRATMVREMMETGAAVMQETLSAPGAAEQE